MSYLGAQKTWGGAARKLAMHGDQSAFAASTKQPGEGRRKARVWVLGNACAADPSGNSTSLQRSSGDLRALPETEQNLGSACAADPCPGPAASPAGGARPQGLPEPARPRAEGAGRRRGKPGTSGSGRRTVDERRCPMRL